MKKTNKKYDSVVIMTLVMLLVSFMLIICGVTAALYKNFLKGTTNNVIQAGMISFSYDEAISRENGIKIEDALPKADRLGKIASGKHEYFDFSVNATSTISDISYQVYVLKQNTSTLRDDYVKIYLTLKNGNDEVVSPLVVTNDVVTTYDELTGTKTEKLVYNGVVPKGANEYHQDFRLRMWIADDVDVTNDDFIGKRFSVKVKVSANQVR